MIWLGRFLIGTSPTEMTEVGRMRSSFDIQPRILAQSGRIADGELRRRNIGKIVEDVRVRCEMMTKDVAEELTSIILMANEYIYIKCLSEGWLFKQIRKPRTTSIIQGIKTSHRFITVESVYLTTDIGGTNYYTGGSYDEENYLITLGTPLPSTPGIEVIITYRYQGWKGVVDSHSITPTHRSVKETGYFDIDFTLEGI